MIEVGGEEREPIPIEKKSLRTPREAPKMSNPKEGKSTFLHEPLDLPPKPTLIEICRRRIDPSQKNKTSNST